MVTSFYFTVSYTILISEICTSCGDAIYRSLIQVEETWYRGVYEIHISKKTSCNKRLVDILLC